MLAPIRPDAHAALQRENAELRLRLEEAEETLRALGQGEVDAIVVGTDIFTLEGVEAAANRFRSDVLAQMEEAVIALDAGGHVVYLNPAAERQYGTTASLALGLALEYLYTVEWLAAEDEAAAQQALATSGSWRGRNVHRTRQGKAVRIESSLNRLHDAQGRPSGMLIVARDVSESAAAETALGESRARLQFALESARIGEWELDLRQGTSHRSLRHDQCFGYSTPLPHWSLALLLDHVVEEDRERVAGEFNTRLPELGEIHLECRVLWPDGHRHWIEMHAAQFNHGSAARRIVGTVSDISQRKRAEAALLGADRRKDVFLATLAHELRNPLAPIRNSVQIMRISQDEALRQRALATVEKQLAHMVRLVDDLMDVSRITQGKMELRRDVINVAEILANAVDSARPLIESRQHRFELRLPPRALHVDGDMTRLTQVVANLLDNAAKYTPEGGRILLSATGDEHAVRITVQDTGMGIAAGLLPHIFDLFTQADTRRQPQHCGMGIGLALVKRLVDMHGGSVDVYSEGEGFGCRVEVRLPRVANTPAVAALPAPEPRAGQPRWRVMVAEDNPDSAQSMAMMLQLMGHDVAIASDGIEAVDTASSFRPHVVLMDIGMPGLDGYEAARRIRAQSWGRDMMLVALTGWGQDEDRQRSRDAGMDRHLVKPVDPALLTALFESAAAAH